MNINLKFEEFPISKWSNNLFKYVLTCYSLVFYIWLCSLFLARESVLKTTTKFCILIFLLFHIFEIIFAWLCSILVMLSGDVEVNLGTKKKVHCLSICHWNLNSVSPYDYSKLFLLSSYNSLHKFDIICLSETILDSNTPLNLKIWKSLVTRFVLIVHLIPNAELSVFTAKTIYL